MINAVLNVKVKFIFEAVETTQTRRAAEMSTIHSKEVSLHMHGSDTQRLFLQTHKVSGDDTCQNINSLTSLELGPENTDCQYLVQQWLCALNIKYYFGKKYACTGRTRVSVGSYCLSFCSSE